MNLTILSPEREVFAGAVKSITVPGTDGGFQMLENHAPIVSALRDGEVKIVKADGEIMLLTIGGGFVELLHNEVSLLVSGVV